MENLSVFHSALFNCVLCALVKRCKHFYCDNKALGKNTIGGQKAGHLWCFYLISENIIFRYAVSAAETGGQDVYQMIVTGVVVIVAHAAQADG